MKNKMFADLGKKVMKISSKATLFAKEHGSDIALIVGISGGVVAGVMACFATTDVPQVMEDTKEELDAIKTSDLSEEESAKEIARTYTKTAIKVAKVYLPSVTVGGLSIACIVWSHGNMKKQNLALASACATVTQSFKQYRERVIDRYGEDVDYEMRTGVCKEVVQTKVVDENGAETVVNTPVEYVNPQSMSGYGRVFDDTNYFWKPMMDRNFLFLTSRMQYLNDILHIRGYLFLNEVYRELGFEDTQAGAVVGWVMDEDPESISDNRVDFTPKQIDIPDEENEGEFKKAYVLDFNVDGPILNRTKLAKI